MIYVVLGMHKSGTTLISQILHNAGINMVDGFDLDLSYDRGNKCERESTKAINHEILDSKGVFSLDIKLPQTLQSNAELRQKIQKVIRTCNSNYEHWGFKDPRTCLTYPIWKSELPEHKLIVIYRSPGEIWQRYFKSRKKYSSSPYAYLQGAWKFMKNWCIYNQKVISYLEHSEVDFLVLNYQKFMTEDSEFMRLQKFTQRDLVDCRDRRLYRNQGGSVADELLNIFCFLETFHHPNAISQRLENLH